MFAIVLTLTGIGFAAFAQEEPPTADTKEMAQKFTDESELAIVSVAGNSSSSNYAGKQKNTFTWDKKNTLIASGHYLRTETSGTETAKNWDLTGRYERVIHDGFSGYIGYGADSDPYAGYVQRDNFDIGGKQELIKNPNHNWWVEAGYRYSKMNTTADMQYANMGRLFTEYDFTLDKTFSAKYWFEYLPNFTDSHAYFINTEPSVSMLLTQILSFKVAYLVQYHNKLIKAGEVYTDTTFTTSLVAKF